MSEPCYGQERDERLPNLFQRCSRILYYHSTQGKRQGSVLQMLQRGPLSQKEIQEQLCTAPGSVSELISKLEDKGLLVRQRSEADRRIVVLTLTEKGQKAAHHHDERPSSELFSVLTEEERDELLQMMERMLAAWSEKEDSRT